MSLRRKIETAREEDSEFYRLQRNGNGGNRGHSLLKAARRRLIPGGMKRMRSNGQAFK